MVFGFKTSLDIYPNWINFQRTNHVPCWRLDHQRSIFSSHQSKNF